MFKYSIPEDNEIKRIEKMLEITDPTIAYNGAPQSYEDPADYLPRSLTIKGEVIA